MSLSASETLSARYKVTIENTSKAHVLSKPVLVLHKRSFRVFKVEKEASEGLVKLAEDGITEDLVAELLANERKVDGAMGAQAVIEPGEKAEYTIGTNRPKSIRFSVVTKLATTNDAFLALDSERLPDLDEPKELELSSFDAGSEANNELCEFIPGPPCNNLEVRATEGAEGLISEFIGLEGVGDIDAEKFETASSQAKITIERLR